MDKFRWQKIQTKIKKGQGFLVTDKSDLFYLTGFGPEGYWGLLTGSKFFLLLLPLLYEQAVDYLKSKPGKTFSLLRGKDLFTLFRGVLKREKLKTILFDPEKISFGTIEKLKKIGKVEFSSSKEMMANLREIKDEDEISLIGKSCQLTLTGYQYAKKIIHPGMSERDLAREVEYYLKKKGAEKVAFETIVAGGGNSSYPHHLTSDYVFQKNDTVLLDLGVVYQGYNSDLTRVIFLGKIPMFVKKIYKIVKKAQENAIQGIKPGVPAKEIYACAYRVFKETGYAKYFLHSLGHGIGINIHEKPYINPRNQEILQPGMVFTIEPGIYIPQKFGIRIEDVVLVTEKGYEILTESMSYEV